jgi:hypothetical protein
MKREIRLGVPGEHTVERGADRFRASAGRRRIRKG